MPGGSFAAPISVLPSPPSADWQALDFDGDELVDLVGGGLESDPDRVWIALATAPAVFAPPTSHLASRCTPIRAGDVDGDGHLDLITKGNDETVTTLLGDGAGSAVSVEHYPYPIGVSHPMATGDFDGDGRLDVAGWSESAVGVQYGEAGGAFSALTSYPSGGPFDSLAVGDLDQDGYSDVVVSSVELETLHVVLADGAGGLLPPTAIPAGNHPYTPAIGDVTADGVPDIVVADGPWWTGQFLAYGNQIRVLRGIGNGSFQAPVSYTVPFGVWWPTIGDVDEDGFNDVMAGTINGIVLLLGQADGTLAEESIVTPSSSEERPTLADLDGDGHLDCIDTLFLEVRVLLGDGLGGFPTQLVTSGLKAHQAVAVADFDDDGRLEIAFNSGGRLGLLELDDQGQFEPPRYFAAGNSPAYLASGDVDGDARMDILAISPTLVVSRNLGPAPLVGVYCTAKVNSKGCEPAIGSTGTPSASQASGFVVSATELVNQKLGLLLYGVNGSAATPFAGGLRCIAPPVRRTVSSSTGGSTPPTSDCSGTIAIDMNAFAAGLFGNPHPALSMAGTHVHCQLWARDKAPSNVQLSDALAVLRPALALDPWAEGGGAQPRAKCSGSAGRRASLP